MKPYANTNLKQSQNKKKALLLIGLGVLLIFIAIFALTQSGNSPKVNDLSNYETYQGEGFSSLRPKGYEVEKTSDSIKFTSNKASEDETLPKESLTIEKFSKSAGVTTDSLKQSSQLDASGKRISSINIEQKESGGKKYLIVSSPKTKTSLATKKAYVFGPSSIWLLTFSTNSKSSLLSSSDTIIEGFQPDKYPFE